MLDNPICRYASRSEWDVVIQVVIAYVFNEKSNHNKTYDHNQDIDIEYIIDDGKWYSPCIKCKGMKRRRIIKSTSRKHCWDHGHREGGKKYHPFVI